MDIHMPFTKLTLVPTCLLIVFINWGGSCIHNVLLGATLIGLIDDQWVGVLYTNVMCAVTNAQASYLESIYGEHARVRSSKLRTYQLMNTSCTIESGYSYAHQSYLQVIANVQFRQFLSRFRCSNHRLEVECGRHVKPESVPRRDRVCCLYSLTRPQVPCVTQNGSKELDLRKWLETWCPSQLLGLKRAEGSCWKLWD
jgi:hypothetical protein